MHNWSVDAKELKKDKNHYAIWRLEQMINFGLGNKRMNRKELKNNWSKLDIDPLKKKYLKMILWPKQF